MLVNTNEMTVLITGEPPSWLDVATDQYHNQPLSLDQLLVPTESPYHYLTRITNRLLYMCAHPVSSPHHMLLFACDVTDLKAGKHMSLRLTEYGVIEAYSVDGVAQDPVTDEKVLNRPVMSLVHELDVGLLCRALNDRSDCRVRWQVNPSTHYWDEEKDNVYYAWSNIYVQDQQGWLMCVVELSELSATGSEWKLLNFACHPTQNGPLLHMVQMRLIETSLYHAMDSTIRAFTKLSTMAILSLTKGNSNYSIHKYISQLKANLRHQETRPSIHFVLSLLAHLHVLGTPSSPREFVEGTLDAIANSVATSAAQATPPSIV